MLSGSQGDGQWIVPITLCCGSYATRQNHLFQTKSESLDVKEVLGCSISQSKNDKDSWIKLNVDQSGFYRVKYDDDLSARLRYAIEKKCLSATDRYGNFSVLFFGLCVRSSQDWLTLSLFILGRHFGGLVCLMHGLQAVSNFIAYLHGCFQGGT